MNRWKIAFFTLAGLVAAAIAYLIFLIGTPTESDPLPEVEINQPSSNYLTVRATKEDFEGIANSYIRKARRGDPLPVEMKIDDDIVLATELTVFGYTVPFNMHFDPVVQQDGNLILKQSSVEVGNLNIAPSTVLTLLKESVKLPPWMIVRPKEEELFINLSAIPVSGNLRVKAKTFNLAKDEIILEILIPEE
jgi:uncharacterized protein YpmS